MQLAEIYRQIPSSKCPDGCGECCGILFPSLAEIRDIREWCTVHHIDFRDFTMDLSADCPYLLPDKHCQIYPVRPILCRLLGVTEEKHLQCVKCTPERRLNLVQTRYLFKQVYGTRKERRREFKHQRELETIFGSPSH
jgi:Fe-S-cluster containining protein